MHGSANRVAVGARRRQGDRSGRRLACVGAVAAVLLGACQDATAPVRPAEPTLPGPPASVQVIQGDGQVAPAGATVPAPIRVAVRDSSGKPTPGVPVTFQASAGGGTVAEGGTALTDAAGVATAPAWTLGQRLVPQELTASAGGVTRVIGATVQAGLPIELRFVGAIPEAQQAPVRAAVERLRGVMMAGAGPAPLTDFSVATYCGVSGGPTLNETVAGIVVYVTVEPIDGAGNLLGRAGPCALRGAVGHHLPAVATLTLDVADLPRMIDNGTAESVATHELMHALGLGTLWSVQANLAGPMSADPRFTGRSALAACDGLGAAGTCAGGVPVENTGGAATQGLHWRRTAFPGELMTGWISLPSYLSAISIASMTDLGYTVNLAAADSYTPAGKLPGGSTTTAAARGVELSGFEALRTMPLDGNVLQAMRGVLVVRPEKLRETIRLE